MKAILVALVCLMAGSAASGRAIRASADPVKDEPPITDEDRGHWAFRPLQGVPADAASNSAAAGTWQAARSQLDALIEQKLALAGLKRSESADAAALMRRVTFDLTGLPPAVEEVRAFAAACAKGATEADAAYEALVDRLLAKPQYGEHWAQPWLDLARYAETDGFEHDRERNRAWQFRDWVIEALNKDLPFDQFVRQQIAGDLLPDGEAVATGFLFAGPDMPDLNNQDERRHVVLNDITSTVGSVFLGLTVGCAQCHDHAYDPVSQADFYRLRAFFENTVQLKREMQLGPSLREFSEGVPAPAVFIRGDFRRPGPVVEPAFLRIAEAGSAAAPAAAKRDRVALAAWLTRPDNALFLRATVNRIWQQHFGIPLAPTPGDLGRQSEPPTHPELLDWLALELPRQQWSLKRLHKVIVMSQTYRQATQAPDVPPEAVRLYGCMPRKRLTGEMVRDAMLSVAGALNPKAGGPSVRLPLPPEILGNLKRKDEPTKDAAEHQRRSIYAFARRNARHPLFDLFDRPDPLMSCSRRSESTTAPQALLLLNSEFAHDMAKRLAELAIRTAGSGSEALAEFVSWRCYGRAPSDPERQAAEQFIAAQTARTGALNEAVADYCLAIINANEFLYID